MVQCEAQLGTHTPPPPIRLQRTGYTETDPQGRTWHLVEVEGRSDLPECTWCGFPVHPGGWLFVDEQGGGWVQCMLCSLRAPEAPIPAGPAPFQVGEPEAFSTAVNEHEGADEGDTDSFWDYELPNVPF